MNYLLRSAEYLHYDDSRIGNMNYGYAVLWLCDVYVKLKKYDLAVSNISKAIDIWTEHTPARLKKISKHIEGYPTEFRMKYLKEIKISF